MAIGLVVVALLIGGLTYVRTNHSSTRVASAGIISVSISDISGIPGNESGTSSDVSWMSGLPAEETTIDEQATRPPTPDRTSEQLPQLERVLPNPPRPVPENTGAREPITGTFSGFATHYGENYNGKPLGCGTGPYSSGNKSIAASPWRPDRGYRFPCGTVLLLQGSSGIVLEVSIQDACPGCNWETTIDLSEAGIELICPGKGSCPILIQVGRSR